MGSFYWMQVITDRIQKLAIVALQIIAKVAC